MYAYVGTRTTRERNARGEGISVFRCDAATGALSLVQVLGDLSNPSYLMVHPRQSVLYTVHGDGGEISAFKRDAVTGALTFWHRQACEGINPVHLALSPSGRYLVVSNHRTGTLAVLSVTEDGQLGPVRQLVGIEGEPGPHRIEQPFSKPHFNLFDPSGRYVAVPDKGLDRVFIHAADAEALSATPVCVVHARESAGPRHAAFHPSARFMYVINELDNTVTAHTFDAATGTAIPFQLLPSLSDACTGNSRAAGISTDAAGRFLYVSNRGHDGISVFAIDAESGRLSLVEFVDSLGRTPRFFTLSPDGRFMFVANEESDTIVRFAVDRATGRLTPNGAVTPVASPVCIVFA